MAEIGGKWKVVKKQLISMADDADEKFTINHLSTEAANQKGYADNSILTAEDVLSIVDLMAMNAGERTPIIEKVADMARRHGITEAEALEKLRMLQEMGYLKLVDRADGFVEFYVYLSPGRWRADV